jgi:mono/diheme cytochrome c family protein
MRVLFFIIALFAIACWQPINLIAGTNAGGPDKFAHGYLTFFTISRTSLAQAGDGPNASQGDLESRPGPARPGIDIPADELERVNPILPTPRSVAMGRGLFIQFCAPCHGQTGKGNGPLAASFATPPTDLTMEPRKYGDRDGELFWLISNGISGTGMPPWKVILTERQRWEIINYIRSLTK